MKILNQIKQINKIIKISYSKKVIPEGMKLWTTNLAKPTVLLSEIFQKNKVVVFGVPAAFTPTCNIIN
jgi:peroxiredoxin